VPAPPALWNIYPVKCGAYFSGAKSIPPGFTPLNSEGQRSAFNRGSSGRWYWRPSRLAVQETNKISALIKIYPACPACPVAPADGTGVKLLLLLFIWDAVPIAKKKLTYSEHGINFLITD